MTELVRGMGLFPFWRHSLIYIALALCEHACKTVCDVKSVLPVYQKSSFYCNLGWYVHSFILLWLHTNLILAWFKPVKFRTNARILQYLTKSRSFKNFIFVASQLQRNYCKQGHPDKVNQSHGRTRMIHFKILIWANQILRRLHRVFDRARSRARAARFESLRMLK